MEAWLRRARVISNPLASELILPEIERLHVLLIYNIFLGRETAMSCRPYHVDRATGIDMTSIPRLWLGTS